MIAKPCVVDYWRNDIPVAPTFEFSTPNTMEFVIPMKSVMIQGARDFETNDSPSPNVLDKVPAQRGWRLQLIISSEPTNGTVRISTDGESFIYTPRGAFVGTDCFSYSLTNGFQQSVTSNITVHCVRGYEYDLLIFRRNIARTSHRFQVTAAFDFSSLNLPQIYLIFCEWYYTQYVEVMDGKVKRVKKVKKLVAQTTWNRSFYDQVQAFAPTLTSTGMVPTIETYFDGNLSGLLEDTAQVFHPQNLPGEIEVEMKLYTETKQTPLPNNPSQTRIQVDLSKFILFKKSVTTIYGKRWTDSGNVQI